MLDKNFLKAEKIFPHDKLMEKTVLKLVPKRVYPNHFTLFRFITAPLVGVLMLYEHYFIGLLVFLLVSFTDAIDGSLARTRDQITRWGKVYDPLADKILISIMVFIIVLRYIDIWTAGIIIAMEAVIIVVAWSRKHQGGEIQSNIRGQIKMGLQVLGVVILLFAIIFEWGALLPLASGALYLAIAFAVVSLLTYGI